MSMVDPTTDWKLPSPADFERFYQQNLAGAIDACEVERRQIVRKLYLLVGVTLSFAVVLAIIVGSVFDPAALIFVAIAAIAVLAIGYYSITHGFRSQFKLGIVSQLVRFFGHDFRYAPTSYIPDSRFRQSRIFDQRIDRYRGEDFISGTAGKTHFECSEIHAEYKTTTTDSKGRRRTQWHTIFRGLFFIADFNKHFHGTTLVLPDAAEAAFGWLGQKLQAMNFSRPGELVKLEDAEFEKLFVVYSTDQIEARYILSPALMRRLVDFRRKFRHAVHLSFIGGSVYVAVNPGKNLLEPSLSRPVTFESCCELFEDICLVLAIIDDLNLNTRIWTKE